MCVGLCMRIEGKVAFAFQLFLNRFQFAVVVDVFVSFRFDQRSRVHFP